MAWTVRRRVDPDARGEHRDDIQFRSKCRADLRFRGPGFVQPRVVPVDRAPAGVARNRRVAVAPDGPAQVVEWLGSDPIDPKVVRLPRREAEPHPWVGAVPSEAAERERIAGPQGALGLALLLLTAQVLGGEAVESEAHGRAHDKVVVAPDLVSVFISGVADEPVVP